VFIEWSVANDEDYVKDINFPSNMLYSAMLKSAGELYGDSRLIEKAEKIKKAVVKYSYNGEFFVDNAKVVDGKVVPYEDHISETCQYYALFFNIYGEEKFVDFMKDNFGPNRKDGFEKVGKSNAFIGNYLRLLWLLEIKQYDRVLNESIEFFYKMAQETGSLWEHDLPTASCNHGFASVIAVILISALLGYKTVENGELVFDKDFKRNDEITVEKTK
jgi:alpha-L-rhamnosidase